MAILVRTCINKYCFDDLLKSVIARGTRRTEGGTLTLKVWTTTTNFCMCTINRNIYIVCAHTILYGLHRNNKAEQ